MPRLKVLFVVSECVPFAKTGGLADVAGALPIALATRGHDVRVVLPRYRSTLSQPARRLPDPLGVPLGSGEAWGAVWESSLRSKSNANGAQRGEAKGYLLENEAFFNRDGVYGDAHGEFGDNLARYTFLSRGALQLCKLLDFIPDVVHVHDWPTSLVPV